MWERTPKRPEEIFPGFISDLESVFGRELESVYLFGSGARGDYRPGKSDLNFLVCLLPAGMDKLEGVWQYIKKWRRKKIALPLFITRDFIRTSIDVFPIEYLNMKLHHRLLHGVDILSELNIAGGHLRLQLERELRGKLLTLWQGFAASEGKDKVLAGLISSSISAFSSLFAALIYLKGEEVPKSRREIFSHLEEMMGLEKGVLGRCLEVREGRIRPGGEELRKLYIKYMEAIGHICQAVDRMHESR